MAFFSKAPKHKWWVKFKITYRRGDGSEFSKNTEFFTTEISSAKRIKQAKSKKMMYAFINQLEIISAEQVGEDPATRKERKNFNL